MTTFWRALAECVRLIPDEVARRLDKTARALAGPPELHWHYGPSSGRMWCDDCDGEVYAFDDGLICSGCGRQEEL